MRNQTKDAMEKLFRSFLDQNDLDGANFDDTPKRVAAVWDSFLHVPRPEMRAFPTTSNQMAVLKNYITWGFCPHHLLPVEYTFKIGYIPQDRVVGLSKLARLADYHLSKLPLQEDIGDMIVNDLHEVLKPLGVGCRITGRHLCIGMRGVKSPCAEFVTTALKGMILINPASHDEFLNA